MDVFNETDETGVERGREVFRARPVVDLQTMRLYVLPAYYMLLFAIGLPGNIWVITIVLRIFRTLRSQVPKASFCS